MNGVSFFTENNMPKKTDNTYWEKGTDEGELNMDEDYSQFTPNDEGNEFPAVHTISGIVLDPPNILTIGSKYAGGKLSIKKRNFDDSESTYLLYNFLMDGDESFVNIVAGSELITSGPKIILLDDDLISVNDIQNFDDDVARNFISSLFDAPTLEKTDVEISYSITIDEIRALTHGNTFTINYSLTDNNGRFTSNTKEILVVTTILPQIYDINFYRPEAATGYHSGSVRIQYSDTTNIYSSHINPKKQDGTAWTYETNTFTPDDNYRRFRPNTTDYTYTIRITLQWGDIITVGSTTTTGDRGSFSINQVTDETGPVYNELVATEVMDSNNPPYTITYGLGLT